MLMFYDLVMKNSKRSRKENGLFFASLIVAIVSFYIILSLEKQDVIIFLKTIESDALDKLFLLIPVLYGFSLFILFFLVYFAGKYQLERRSKELGMYMMLGMKRRKLLLMLFAEEIWNSLISLVIGIPLSIFISEIISLITAKTVGMGIVGHNFSFSILAVLGTVAGYFIIRMIALTILSGNFSRKEIMELFSDSQVEKHREVNKLKASIQIILGLVFLAIAFTMTILNIAWQQKFYFGIAVIVGICGVFLLFKGAGILFEILLLNRINKNGLSMFSFRQVQESVFLKPNLLTISSVLIIMALCCFTYGISVATVFNTEEEHVIDYTFEEDYDKLMTEIKALDLEQYINSVTSMEIGIFNPENKTATVSIKNLVEAVNKQKDSEVKEIMINNLQYFDSPYLISLDSYNQLLKLEGKKPLELKDNQIAFYSDPEYVSQGKIEIFNSALKERPSIKLGEESYELVDKYYYDSVVTDRLITISYGLIVTDNVFKKYTNENNVITYLNATLNEEFVKEVGLMQAISRVNEKLNTTDIYYESYLQNMGRELFYTVAASYTTIYLALIFLIIANTVIGVQFLMHQQKTKKRYQSLTYLGANYEMICKSARNQISWYFTLPLVVATISSIFGVRGLFSGILSVNMKGEVNKLMIVSIPIILLLLVIELFYMNMVKRNSDKNILRLMDIKREDS